jgi:hypothetical protein
MHRFLSTCRRQLQRPSAARCAISSTASSRSIANQSLAAASTCQVPCLPNLPAVQGSHYALNSYNFSSVAAPSSKPFNKSSSEDNNDSSKDQSKNKKDDSNIFLDNLGKIFLSTIALVLLSLLRSNKGNNAKAALRDDIESTALLDPLEISDLRDANDFITREVWDEIVQEFVTGGIVDRVTYGQFMNTVLKVLRRKAGEGATVQYGHLMDRVVVKEMEKIVEQNRVEGDVELPLLFLLTAFSLAMNSSVADRVQSLYDVMILSQGDNADGSNNEQTVPMRKVKEMVQHLQSTCQLVPDAQIVPTISNIPYQTYRVGDGAELTQRACQGLGMGDDEGKAVDLEDFYSILKSRSVCAWGECYVKKTDKMATSDR